MTFAAVPDCPPDLPRPPAGLRYAGVLAVWAGLFVVRPRLALAIWRETGPSRRRRSAGRR